MNTMFFLNVSAALHTMQLVCLDMHVDIFHFQGHFSYHVCIWFPFLLLGSCNEKTSENSSSISIVIKIPTLWDDDTNFMMKTPALWWRDQFFLWWKDQFCDEETSFVMNRPVLWWRDQFVMKRPVLWWGHQICDEYTRSVMKTPVLW